VLPDEEPDKRYLEEAAFPGATIVLLLQCRKEIVKDRATNDELESELRNERADRV
jgi:hypothetical protein